MQTPSKTLLLVEDEAVIAMQERMALEALGYSVVLAYSGEEAIAATKMAPVIDLILMDIDLGQGINGMEAARQILARKDIPIIFLSTNNETGIIYKLNIIFIPWIGIE